MKRILIDANPVVPYLASGKINGIGRTCMELISELGKMKNTLPFEINLYTQNLRGVDATPLNTGFRCHHLHFRNTPIWNQSARILHLRELMTRYDLQHITHNYEIVTDPSQCIVTVHDAFFMKFDTSNFDYAKFRKIYPPFIRSARHIITCSEYSAKDIEETIFIPRDKITVIPWGVDHNIFYVEDNRDENRLKLLQNFGISNQYFLSVSCDAGRKRTPDLIKSYLTLENPVNDLVLVWNNPPEKVLKIINRNPRVHLLSGISNDDLRILYNCAIASVNPTAYEGFGLPILEAMACGCATVTCFNSSLPEVGGDVAIYIDEPITETLPCILHDIDNGSVDLTQARNEGPIRAALFTWERTAKETAAVYTHELNKLYKY